MPFQFRILIIIHRVDSIRNIHRGTTDITNIVLVVEISGVTQNSLMTLQLIGERGLHTNHRVALFQIDDNILCAGSYEHPEDRKNQPYSIPLHGS